MLVGVSSPLACLVNLNPVADEDGSPAQIDSTQSGRPIDTSHGEDASSDGSRESTDTLSDLPAGHSAVTSSWSRDLYDRLCLHLARRVLCRTCVSLEGWRALALRTAHELPFAGMLVKPTFVGVGSMKCASTWVAECLREHPQVQLSQPKETVYFNYHTGLDDYLDFFDHSQTDTPKLAIGEFTPNTSCVSSARYLLTAVTASDWSMANRVGRM